MRSITEKTPVRADALEPAPPRGPAHEARPASLEELLRLPTARAAAPKLLCDGELLTHPVLGVRLIDLAYAHGELHAGDLAVVRGTGLPVAESDVAAYVDYLADHRIAGLAIELSHQYPQVPPTMVAACRRRALPALAFEGEGMLARFVDEARGAVLGGQVQLLETTLAAHERFTELTLAEASVQDIVAAAAALAGAQAVYANMLHQAVAIGTDGGSAVLLLERWRHESFATIGSLGVEVNEARDAVVAPVVARGRQRGWLTIFSDGAPTAVHAMIAERAATALAIRLRGESDEALVATANHNLLADIVSGRFTAVEAMHARAEALGHPIRGRRMLPIAIRWDHAGADEILRRALADTRLEGIVGEVGRQGFGVLLLSEPNVERRVAQFAARVHQLCAARASDRAVLARGPSVVHYADVRCAFSEAFEVAGVAAAKAAAPATREPDCYSISDVRLRGLLHILGDDPRVQSFAARTLSPLLARDSREGGELVRTLGVYLQLGGNKSLTAQRLRISRQTLYERLARTEALLGAVVDDPETSASLFAAIMVVEAGVGLGQGAEQMFAPQ